MPTPRSRHQMWNASLSARKMPFKTSTLWWQKELSRRKRWTRKSVQQNSRRSKTLHSIAIQLPKRKMCGKIKVLQSHQRLRGQKWRAERMYMLQLFKGNGSNKNLRRHQTLLGQNWWKSDLLWNEVYWGDVVQVWKVSFLKHKVWIFLNCSFQNCSFSSAYCIPLEMVCDKRADCPNAADEEFCHGFYKYDTV